MKPATNLTCNDVLKQDTGIWGIRFPDCHGGPSKFDNTTRIIKQVVYESGVDFTHMLRVQRSVAIAPDEKKPAENQQKDCDNFPNSNVARWHSKFIRVPKLDSEHNNYHVIWVIEFFGVEHLMILLFIP